MKFPPDPLLEQERRLLRNANAFSRAIEKWNRDHEGVIPPEEVLLTHEEHRKTLIEIQHLRLQRSKVAIAERVALAKLPAIDEEALTREVDRVLVERLSQISPGMLRQLAEEREREEQLSLGGGGDDDD